MLNIDVKKYILPSNIYLSKSETTIREDRKLRAVGTFTWNHSLTFNISGSNKDIFKNKALIDSRGFFILKYLIFFSILMTSLAYGSK